MRPIAYDVTRLFLGPLSRTPRGIDRVDLAYAEHFFGTRADALAVLPTPWGVRCFGAERVLQGLKRLRALWSEPLTPETDPAYLNLRARLLGNSEAAATAPPRGPNLASRILSLLQATGLGVGESVQRAVPQDAIFISVGHLGLAFPFALRWLEQRPDVFPIFMLHDAIPVEAPEYVEPAGVRGHIKMLDAVARYAKGLIATTLTARDSVDVQLAMRGCTGIPAFVRPLPASEAFGPHVKPDPALEGYAYFVACATLEPRKNLELLSEIWKRLSAEMGDAAPHLVIAGAKGFTGEQIAARLQLSPSTTNRLHLTYGLSTPALAQLIAGARALLSPSFIEGYGLTIVEAQAIGTWVIASDIPSHREIKGRSILIDPIDGLKWLEIISGIKGSGSVGGSGAIEHWSTYFKAFEEWINKSLVLK
jgi:glycosyltransferase involved in cell wall biosynthesis